MNSTLDPLARDINAAHAAFTGRTRDHFEFALRCGELLVAAKARAGHGRWADWVAENCDFSIKMASNYMRIFNERDALEANAQRVADLSVRAALSALTESDDEPSAEVIDVSREMCAVSDLSELIDSGKRFGTIYADPPWQYGNQSTRAATDNHYGTMTIADIEALPVKQLAADRSHLHLWTTNAFLFESRSIMDAWGFDYKGLHVWCKPQLGIGNYWRVSHEILLLGVRGGLTAAARNETSWTVANRIGHSIKPEVFREKIEKLSPGPYLELFARRVSPGWTVWGNEIAKDLFSASVGV